MSTWTPEHVRHQRERHNLTQAQLALLVGVRPAAVSHWETGRRAPMADTQARLAEVFGTLDQHRRITGVDPDVVNAQADQYLETLADRVQGLFAGVIDSWTADTVVTPDDLNPVREQWAAALDDLLQPVADAYQQGVDAVRDQLQRAVDNALVADAARITGSLEPGRVGVRTAEGEQYLAEARNRLRHVPDDVWDDARDALLVGLQQGEAIPEMAGRVRGIVAETYHRRSVVIARTEIVAASNWGQQSMMNATGLPYTKTWLATGDDRTRETHADADGQTVPHDKTYTVGGCELRTPGDPWAACGHETIQCRCSESYEIPPERDLRHLLDPATPDALIAQAGPFTTAMIALVPADPDSHAVADGEPADQLHVTLAFLGEVAELTDDALAAAEQVARDTAARFRPVDAQVAGRGTLGAEDPPAAVVFLNGREMDQLREAVWAGLGDYGWEAYHPQHQPWIPHMTLGYGLDPEQLEPPEQITLDVVRYAVGDDVQDFPLGVRALAGSATQEATAMPWSITENHTDCPTGQPFGVVNDDTGDLEEGGCHSTRDEAQAHVDALYANAAPGDEMESAMTDDHFGTTDSSISEQPWDGAASRFTDEQYQMATAACDPGDGTIKERCHLPHHEPGGATSRAGVHAAAQRIGQTNMTAESRASAKAHLRAHYTQLGEDPPDSVAAQLELTTAEKLYLANHYPTVAAADDALFFLASGAGLPTGESMAVPRLSAEQSQQLADFVTAMATAEDDVQAAPWSGTLVVEGLETGDGREFEPGVLGWMDPPLPLRWQKETDHGGEHDVTVAVGVIEAVWREEGDEHNKLRGIGHLDLGNPDGAEYHRRRQAGMAVGGISVDVDDIKDADVEFVWGDDDGTEDDGDIMMLLFARPEKMIFHGGRLRAATLVDIPAFVEAKIDLITEEEFAELAAKARQLIAAANPDAVTASAGAGDLGYVPPPADAFKDPQLSHPTFIHVTDPDENGWRRVYGHAAPWGQCHIGIDNDCVMVPHENGHPYYMVGELDVDDGTTVPVGQIVLGTDHATLRANRVAATQHYANTGRVVADVAVGNDKHGVWVSGVIRPDANEADVRALRASGRLSGDWRRIGGKLRMIALLAVTAGGYQIPRQRALVASGNVQALVAAGTAQMGIGQRDIPDDEIERLVEQRLADRRAEQEAKAERLARLQAVREKALQRA